MSETTNPDYLSHNDPAVLQHLQDYQGIIARMAGNSSACKNWAILLVSAVLTFVVADGKPQAAPVAIMAILIFWFLDSYYLGLEKQFRNVFSTNTQKIRDGSFSIDDLFVIKTTGNLPDEFFTAVVSHGTYPVYVGLMGMMGVSWVL